jgi:hypothetical protein
VERLRRLEKLLDRQFTIAGDIVDIAFKSNTRDLRLLVAHLE